MLSYTDAVNLIKVRLSKFTGRDGVERETRMLSYRDSAGGEFELPLHGSLNGELPEMGANCGLVIHSYPWDQARVSQRTGNPYIDRQEKRRIVGVYDVEKGPASKRCVAEYA